jgi:DNA-directed RNA polymerase subunit omega
MRVVNSGVEIGEEPVVNSRYSIVIATSRRARQLIDGDEPLVKADGKKKAFSIAVEELWESKVKILSDEDGEYEQILDDYDDLDDDDLDDDLDYANEDYADTYEETVESDDSSYEEGQEEEGQE